MNRFRHKIARTMKRFELIFTFLKLPLDFILLVCAGLTAYSIRYTPLVVSIRPILFNLKWPHFFQSLLLVAAGWIGIFIVSGLYDANPNRKFSNEITKIVMACSTGFAAITIYVFFTLQKFDSRFLVLAGWLIATVYLIAMRLILHGIKTLCYRYGFGRRRAVIIGSETIAETITTTLQNNPRFGYLIVGTFSAFTKNNSSHILTLQPDEIIFTNPRGNEDETLAAIDFANEHHLTFKYSADLFATISTNLSVSTIAGIPIIELQRTRLNGWGRIIKRLIDIVGSIFFLLLFSPLFGFVALYILIESGRPIIYKNKRVGQNGKLFFTLKFRSMYQRFCTGEQFSSNDKKALALEKELITKQSIKTGPVYKIKDDPRVTPFGRFIRLWSLDELPQFINVLKGEMSLVGPRPHQPREVDNYDTHHKIVLTLKPGITGLTQISGRSNLPFEEEVKLDTFYIEHWSLFLDAIILLKTPFVVLKRDGVL